MTAVGACMLRRSPVLRRSDCCACTVQERAAAGAVHGVQERAPHGSGAALRAPAVLPGLHGCAARQIRQLRQVRWPHQGCTKRLLLTLPPVAICMATHLILPALDLSAAIVCFAAPTCVASYCVDLKINCAR